MSYQEAHMISKYNIARPLVADGETTSNMEGSWEYIE